MTSQTDFNCESFTFSTASRESSFARGRTLEPAPQQSGGGGTNLEGAATNLER